MKKLTCILFLGIAICSQSQPLNRFFEKANGDINLLGISTVDRLQEAPFMEWYLESYSEYEVNTELFQLVDLPDSITIFMGTWCGDSRREVPRFIKILESRNYDLDKLNIICLNTGFQNYKQAPEREERGMDIHRVPTFIFHDEKAKEIGRIVEEPIVSLEQDFADVMNGKVYETAYPVANDMINNFKNYSLKELKKMTPALLKKYKDKSVSISELNTYGYVLWSSWELTKAEFVFELNTKLYPEEARTHSSLARFKSGLGKTKEAMSSVKNGLKIEPENEGLLRMKESLME
jgi:thiol-disulfide isomerase/thioredoxin